MKTVKFIIVAVLAIFLGTNSYAQMHDHSKMDMPKSKTDSKIIVASTKSESLNVLGNCDMCKARIEKAANIDGVTKADWNSKSKILSVAFDPLIINMDQISKKIAAAGHDNGKLKAVDKAYAALPGCCKYDRKK